MAIAGGPGFAAGRNGAAPLAPRFERQTHRRTGDTADRTPEGYGPAGELYPDHFWLLATYHQRGKAEGHMGELTDMLDPSLSSASRPKIHYRGQPLTPATKREARTSTGVRPQNEALFLMNLLAYGILHLGRVLMERATRRGWSLYGFREPVLRVASRVVCHGRQLIFVVSEAATDWRRLWRHLKRVS